MLSRQDGKPGPWTQDLAMQNYRFCNVFREDDKTTQWFRLQIRDQLDRLWLPLAVVSVTAFRWFNRVETAREILPMLRDGVWDSEYVRGKLAGSSPLVTGAYMIKTPAGMSKLEGIIWCMERFTEAEYHLRAAKTLSLEAAWNELRQAPYLGDFMAYEIASDLRWIGLWKRSPDINTWANPGPGAARGMGWVTHGKPDVYNRANPQDRLDLIGLMQWLLAESRKPEHWPSEWPSWEMREVEHWLCEYDKWCRATYNKQSLKRRFQCT